MLDERWDINLNERAEKIIVNRIKELVKDRIKTLVKTYEVYEVCSLERKVMLRNGHMLNVNQDNRYFKLVSQGKVDTNDVFAYVLIDLYSVKETFYHPFLFWYDDIMDVYLIKTLGYGDVSYAEKYSVRPANNLKYIAVGELYEPYLAIEILDLDRLINNLNLSKIVDKVLGKERILTDDKYEEIFAEFESQKLFADHDFYEASETVSDYYHYDDEPFKNDVVRIVDAYNSVLKPYRICFSTENWSQIGCPTPKPLKGHA